MDLKIGADPEFFLFDTKERQYISAHGMIPGDKAAPHKLDCGACQVDGTAVEFNIDPASSSEEFEHNIDAVLTQLRKMIPNRYAFKFEPIVQYNSKYFATIPKESKELGCDPDYQSGDLSLDQRSPVISQSAIGNRRTGSGHIHVGWGSGFDVNNTSHKLDAMLVACWLDAHYRVVRRAWDTDGERTMFYGAQGAYRVKPYGVEYRGPSNAWLNYPSMWQWLFNFVCRAVETMEERSKKTNLFFPSWVSFMEEDNPNYDSSRLVWDQKNLSKENIKTLSKRLGLPVPTFK